MPDQLLALFFTGFLPACLVHLIAGVHQAITGRWSRPLLALAYLAWGGFVFAGLLLTVGNWTDYQYLFWGAWWPQSALLALSGPLLLLVSPREHETALPIQEVAPFARFAGTFVVLSFAAIGTVPLLCCEAGGQRPEPRYHASPTAALVEVVAYGFGGDVPTPMTPVEDTRGPFRPPPRWVTVPLGTTMQSSLAIAVLAMIALVGTFVPGRRVRRLFLFAGPSIGVLVGGVLMRPYDLESAIWMHDPFVFDSYGKVLVLGGAGALVLIGFDVVRCWSARRERSRTAT